MHVEEALTKGIYMGRDGMGWDGMVVVIVR